MKPLNYHDLAWILRRTPVKILTQMKEHPSTILLAGGCIRAIIAHEEVNDFDLFVSTPELALNLANAFAPKQDRAKNDKGLLPGVYATDNAYTIRQKKGPPIQIIHRWCFYNSEDCFSNVEECINSFDFTIAQAAVWYIKDKGWASISNECFYQDLAAKRLIYTAPKRIEEAGGSMLRVLKFYQKGYRIPLDSLGAVIARLVSAVDFKAIKSHTENQEEQLAKVFCGLLREVDPNMDPNHIAHLPVEDESIPLI